MLTPRKSFSTPEEALRALEDAYRAKDLDAAINCKDFRLEAEMMLEKLMNTPKEEIDKDIIEQTSEVLELAFRKEINENGFPDMMGIYSSH